MRVLFTLIVTIISLNSVVVAEAKEVDQDKLDRYLNSLYKNDKAMLSVAVRKEGKLVYSHAVGQRKNDSKSLVNSDTQYRIGSISKTITAALIMQAVEQKKLALDSKLSTFYPNVKNAEQITVKQLLSHRSGLFNFTNDPLYMSYMESPKSKAEILEIIDTYPVNFAPGEKFEYSNTNYVLLGYILEDIYKKTFHEIVQANISKRLELPRTAVGSKIDISKNQADSFYYADGWKPATHTDMSIPHGAGAIVSTAPELTQLLHHLLSGDIVSEASLQQMMKVEQGYGLGLMKYPFGERSAFGHNGGIDGFVSNAAFFPEEDITIAVLSNGVNTNFNGILIGVLSIVFDKPFELPNFAEKSIELSLEQMTELEGSYSSADLPLKLKVFIQDQQLFAQATGQGPFPLTAISPTTFKFERAGIRIEFVSSSDSAKEFVLHQAGKAYRYSLDR